MRHALARGMAALEDRSAAPALDHHTRRDLCRATVRGLCNAFIILKACEAGYTRHADPVNRAPNRPVTDPQAA